MASRNLDRVWTLSKHVGLGLVVVVAVATPWSALAVLNLRLSPHVLWAIPIGIAYVLLAMAYLNGSGWPSSTSAIRRRYFRARSLASREFVWALLAGLAGVVCLWLLFAASGYLSRQPAQGSRIEWSPMALFGAVVIGSAVTSISEEGGLRGFMQTPLERLIGPAPAIATTSLFFVLIHLSHGIPALVRNGPFYLGAGCVYGLLAYLTQSIVPSLLLHFLGDVLAFSLESGLLHLSVSQQGGMRTTLVLSALFAAGTSGAAFVKLARITAAKRSQVNVSSSLTSGQEGP